MLAIIGRLPERGDVVEWDGWQFEVAAMSGLEVERIVARRVEPTREG